jgi:hypothetical protein
MLKKRDVSTPIHFIHDIVILYDGGFAVLGFVGIFGHMPQLCETVREIHGLLRRQLQV